MSEATAPADGAVGEEPADDRPASYEQARDELADVVRRLEAGGLSLEESLALWERGELLADLCQRWLDGARQTLDEALARRSETAGRDQAG